jgi:hypothetical protein
MLDYLEIISIDMIAPVREKPKCSWEGGWREWEATGEVIITIEAHSRLPRD